MLPPTPAAAAASPAPVLMFSYGANCAASVLARRGVKPLSSEAAVVADRGAWLSFSHRGGYAALQHSSGGRVPQPGWQQPHGVLHTLTPADVKRLQEREGGYSLAQLPVETYSGWACTATTFLSSPLLLLYSPVPPTARYRDLLLEGCRQHGLDAGYTAWLEGLEVAPAGGARDARYDACPADSLAQLLAASALAAATWASLR